MDKIGNECCFRKGSQGPASKPLWLDWGIPFLYLPLSFPPTSPLVVVPGACPTSLLLFPSSVYKSFCTQSLPCVLSLCPSALSLTSFGPSSAYSLLFYPCSHSTPPPRSCHTYSCLKGAAFRSPLVLYFYPAEKIKSLYSFSLLLLHNQLNLFYLNASF